MKSLKIGGQLALLSLVALIVSEVQAQSQPGRRTVAKPATFVLEGQGNNVNLSSDGRLYGVTAAIDPETLETIAAGNVEVVFVQNGRIVAQAKSAPNGQYTVSGLQAHNAYSVIARTARPSTDEEAAEMTPMYGASSVVVLPPATQQARADSDSNQFVGQFANNSNSLTLMLVSARDMALVSQPPAAPPAGDTGDVGGGAPPGGGGGGGGGGGRGAGGIAAIGAAAAGLAIASERSGRTITLPFVSPFRP